VQQGGPRLSGEIRWVGEDLSIALRTPQGRLAAVRTLPRSGSCLDLAAASAVVITVWEGEMRADLGPELPAPEGDASPRRTSVPDPAALAIAHSAEANLDSPRPWEIGVGALASQETDLAPGLMAAAQMGRRSSRLAARLGVVVTRAHVLPLGPSPGQSRWSRAAVDLGLRGRTWLGAGAVDLHIELAAAWVHLAGAGFGTNYTRTGFDVGGAAGVRWAWTGDRTAPSVESFVAPFVAMEGVVWPSRQLVTAQGGGAEARLPLFELRAAVGVTFGRFR
jgi:hypothetical protein